MAKIKGILETELCDKTAQDAINNIIDQRGQRYLEKNTEQDLSDILLQSFNWGTTPEGHEYWQKITEEAEYYEAERIKEAAEYDLKHPITECTK